MKRRVNLGSNSQRADYGVSSAVYPILKNISEFLTEILFRRVDLDGFRPLYLKNIFVFIKPAIL